MRCQEVRSLVKNYHEDLLDEYTKIKVHHHLASCHHCTEDYVMWSRGEEYILREPDHTEQIDSPSQVKNLVMQRIKAEEKWANPEVRSQSTYSRKTKRVFTLASAMLILLFLVLFATTLIPQTEVEKNHQVPVESVDENWGMNQIVLQEKMIQEETSMQFEVVAALNHNLTYVIPDEKSNNRLPVIILLSVFGILCVVISMSWLTRA